MCEMVEAKLLSLLVLSDLIKLMKGRTRNSGKKHIRSYKKKGETWYEISFALNGKQVRRKNYASYDEAEADYNSIRMKIRAGEYTSHKAHSLMSFSLTELYKMYCETRGCKRAPSTILNSGQIWARTVDPIIGAIKVRDIRRRHLSMFVRECRMLGFCDNTIQRYAAEVSNVLKMAVEFEILASVPTWPKLDPNPERKAILSPQEIALIVEHIDQAVSTPQYRMMVKTQYRLALRVGELLSLTPAKFDLENGTVLIDSQKLPGPGFRVGPTKTKTSVRLPLSIDLIEELRPYVEDREPNAPLWIGLQLKPVARNAYQYVLQEAARKAGIQKKVSSHCLRASMLDYLVNKTNLSITQVAFYARHSVQTLVSRYVGVDEDGLVEFFRGKMPLSAPLDCNLLSEDPSDSP